MTDLMPNLQLVYVSDITRSTDFYKTIFRQDPVFTSPRYVAWSAGGDAIFAIWSGGETPDSEAKRFSEMGIMLGSNEEVDELYAQWQENPSIDIAQEPSDEVFGRTFLIRDPDGHTIRVCPRD
ncbi:MAG: Phenazine antibiotic resistance protein EhpR [Chlamydiia bacterium]|nr:Phenazine antibiotic resistance protein EhpR [Chlamydiia bacterium]